MKNTLTSILSAISKPFRVFALSLFFLIPVLSSAQESITFKVLPGFAQTYVNKGAFPYWNQSKSALNFATDVEFRLSENFNLLTGLRFYNRGDNLHSLSYREPITSRYFYLSVPVGVVFNTGNFYSGLGYEANILLNKALGISRYKGMEGSGITKSYDYLNGAFFITGYQLNLKENLILSPEIYYSRTFAERFINAGVGVGVRYAL